MWRDPSGLAPEKEKHKERLLDGMTGGNYRVYMASLKAEKEINYLANDYSYMEIFNFMIDMDGMFLRDQANLAQFRLNGNFFPGLGNYSSFNTNSRTWVGPKGSRSDRQEDNSPQNALNNLPTFFKNDFEQRLRVYNECNSILSDYGLAVEFGADIYTNADRSLFYAIWYEGLPQTYEEITKSGKITLTRSFGQCSSIEFIGNIDANLDVQYISLHFHPDIITVQCGNIYRSPNLQEVIAINNKKILSGCEYTAWYGGPSEADKNHSQYPFMYNYVFLLHKNNIQVWWFKKQNYGELKWFPK